MKVFDTAGKLVARVNGQCSVISDDLGFSEWWKKTIAILPNENWEKHASSILEQNGYRVVWYD